MSEKTSSLKLIPVMLAFFAMGFVDLVGIASNYLKADLGLSDSEANIFPSLVFFANDPDLRRRVYGHVDILLPVGYRQRFDADFLEPVIIEYRKRG